MNENNESRRLRGLLGQALAWMRSGDDTPYSLCKDIEAELAAAPIASAQQAEPVGEVVLFGQDLKEVSWRNGRMPEAGTRLYAAPAPSASPAALTDRQIIDLWAESGLSVFTPNWTVLFARALLAASPAGQGEDAWTACPQPEICQGKRCEFCRDTADQVEGAPDMFWNHDDPERCQDSIHNVVVEAYENGCNVGDIVEVQQAIRLHNIKVRIIEDVEDSEEINYELVEDAAMSASKEPK